MFKIIVIFTALLLNLNAFYGATTKEEQCKTLKKLPKVAQEFQKKFKDSKSTLMLYNEHAHIFYDGSRKPLCLDEVTYNSLLKSYAKLLSNTNDERTLKRLLKKNSNTYLYKYLGDLYKKLSDSDDIKYQSKKAEYRLLALKNYNSYVKLGGKPDKDMKLFLKNKGLSKAKNRWFKKFKIDSVPTNSYKVIYFNSNNPTVAVEESIVDYPAVNYSHDKFPNHKLSSQDFAAYWIGDIVFKEDTKKILNFRVSWSEYRLIIDGFEVSKGKQSGAEVPYLFTKGKHRIEVEYLNNYGATDFMMTMYDKREYLPTQEIKSKLSGDFVLLYVGLYETDNFDNSLKIKLSKKYDKPVVLVLSSYGNIDWKVNSNGNDFKAIIVSSQSRGSIVNLQDNKQADTYYLKNFNGVQSLGIKCKCSNLNAYCKGKSFMEFDKRMLNLFGKSLDGYTTFYPRDRTKDKVYNVPAIMLDEKMIKQLIDDEKEAKSIKYECEKEKNLGIDDVF